MKLNEKINENIFRSNDIRGVYQKDFDENFAEALGKAFVSFLKKRADIRKDVVVGRDIRNGSESLKAAVIKGITAAGYNVTDIGIATTPLYYFSVKHLEKSGGIMITGSHLPKEFNGFKIVEKNGSMIGRGAGLEQIKETILNKDFPEPANTGTGTAKKYDRLLDDYSDFVLEKIDIAKKMKVVIDAGNSVGGITAPELFKKAGCEVIVINSELDGNFPSRSPEPRPENLQKLQEAVRAHNADMGAAYDGDGDRVVFVDNTGRIIDSSSLIIMMFAEHYLKTNTDSKIVFDLGCSMALADMIKNMGGAPIETKVGTAFIKNEMVQNSAIFGGESSNHLYFADMFNFDDGAFASLKMAEILSKLPAGTTFADKIKSLPHYPYFPEWEFECPDEKKQQALQMIKDNFKSSSAKFSELDGLKLHYDDGWVLWRPSGTRPSMKIYVEAKTNERLEELKNFAKAELLKAMGV